MSVGRPREFCVETVIEAAIRQFWRKGYEATSVQELLHAMKLSKSSFYQTFVSKKGLFQRCVNYYRDDLCQQLQARLEQSTSGRSFIESTFYSCAEEASKPGAKYGCLIMNTASELAQMDPAIGKLVFDGKEKITEVFLLAIQRGQEEGDISRCRDPNVLAHYLLCSMSGLNTMLKGGDDEKTLKDIVSVVLNSLD